MAERSCTPITDLISTPEGRIAFARSTEEWLAQPLRTRLEPMLPKLFADPEWKAAFAKTTAEYLKRAVQPR